MLFLICAFSSLRSLDLRPFQINFTIFLTQNLTSYRMIMIAQPRAITMKQGYRYIFIYKEQQPNGKNSREILSIFSFLGKEVQRVSWHSSLIFFVCKASLKMR